MASKSPFFWTTRLDQAYIDLCPEIKLGNQYVLSIQPSDFLIAVRDFFKTQRLENGELKIINVTEDVLIWLSCQLKNVVLSFQEDSANEETLEMLAELFWALRNCTTNTQTQTSILEKTDILVSIKNLLIVVKKPERFLKILLQFLVNFITSNRATTESIHTKFIDHIMTFINERIYVYECSALIYNISLYVNLYDTETLELLLDLYDTEYHNEFLCFFIESCISKPEFWNIYEDLKIECRLKILETQNQMQIQNNAHHLLPNHGLDILMKCFLKSGDGIIQTYMNDSLWAHEISCILEILSSISSKEQYLSKLQNCKDVLINAGVWLINVHRLGKMSENCFTPVQKLSESGSINGEHSSHPAFGFKADLVRLIGNMCWKNTQLQDLARKAEIIPIILDCCNMDTKNPFIIQWCILAIRNLCENNPDNQKVIAGLHQNGTVSSQLIDEMGINLHTSEDGQLKIVSLDSLRDNEIH